LAFSDTSADAAAARQLGLFLTGTEAREIASHLTDGDTLTAALRVVSSGRRAEVRALLEALGVGGGSCAVIAVLQAIEGARSAPTTVDPLWTMPGHLAQHGRLTHSVTYLVDSARHSVVCSTFNFQRSSGLWEALQQAAQRPEINMRTRQFDGRPTRNHSKFISIDHRFLLVTSANFSWSAENDNLELGVLINNPNLAEAVEHEMRQVEDFVFERVLVPV
jgi:hypothetical protein